MTTKTTLLRFPKSQSLGPNKGALHEGGRICLSNDFVSYIHTKSSSYGYKQIAFENKRNSKSCLSLPTNHSRRKTNTNKAKIKNRKVLRTVSEACFLTDLLIGFSSTVPAYSKIFLYHVWRALNVPSIAQGNHVCNPICADFPTAPINNRIQITVIACTFVLQNRNKLLGSA
jgi:hypothetical protein